MGALVVKHGLKAGGGIVNRRGVITTRSRRRSGVRIPERGRGACARDLRSTPPSGRPARDEPARWLGGSCATRGFQARAFTLLEVMIVLSLLVLMASIAWPLLETRITKAELPESAERLCSALMMLRSEAVMEHRRYRIRFLPTDSGENEDGEAVDWQQPCLEYEHDPIRNPGVFEPVPAGWAREQILLGDAQVHDVIMGRPAWTLPLATSEDPEELDEEEGELLEEESEEEKQERERFLRSVPVGEDEEIDENRPTIVFESDGSADWVTLVVARVHPEEELEEETPQLWVVLDGRTGLAYVREMITEEELEDTDLYVEREKLELPDTVDMSSLTFNVGGEGGDFSTGDDLAAGGDMYGDGLGDLAGDDLSGQENDGRSTTVTTGGNSGGEAEPRRGQGRRRGGGGEESSGGRKGRRDGAEQLDEKLSDSDLSDEERTKVRKALGGRK